MLEQVTLLLGRISDFIWGPYCLIPLLLGAGLFLTVRLGGLQFRQLGPALRLAFLTRRDSEGPGEISHFQALMTALAATVGTGNIVGVATAIAAGGPGALFWMWMTGLVGMASKYCEALLAVKYRVTDESGQQAGGPMYYLSRGLRWKRTGRVLGAMFALFTALAAFGIGNMVQSNSMASAIQGAFGVPGWITGVVVALALGVVTIGGVRSIGRVTSVLVPSMILLYLLACLWVIIANAAQIPATVSLIFSDAFTGTSAAGGFLGASVAQAMRYGVARGIFSNESGLGSAGIAAAAAQTREPARQALVSMTQTFIDTIIVCSFTGIAIIASGAWQTGINGAPLTQAAFDAAIPGGLGSDIIAFCLALFAFSTIIGWSYYGSQSMSYLFGRRVVLPYQLTFMVVCFAGTIYTLDFVWLFSDVMNGMMALPNLIGLLLLSGVAARETRDYLVRTAAPGASPGVL
ncbi:MAG: sodium:alanine symporter family protein [Gammaproteobacteria bacterium]